MARSVQLEKFKNLLNSYLKDMYEMGDVSRGEYIKKRDYYEAQLDTLRPKIRPDLELAEELFSDFKGNWKAATEKEKKEIIHSIVEKVELDYEDRLVSIEIKPEFKRLFHM